jgi:Fanconi anemia group M protein
MKPIEDIFSNSKTKSGIVECPNPKVLIIIDTREKQSFIAANLLRKKANIKFENLDVGDYLIGDVLIERKNFSDFVSSILDKRLQEQMSNLRKNEKCFLLIEGFDYNYKKFNIRENAVRGMILSVALDFQIPIIYTKNEDETAEFLILTAKKQGNKKQGHSIRQSKTPRTLQEQKQFILEGFPGIGQATAKKLLGKFRSLNEIFKADEEQLKKSEMNDSKIKSFRGILEK